MSTALVSLGRLVRTVVALVPHSVQMSSLLRFLGVCLCLLFFNHTF